MNINYQPNRWLVVVGAILIQLALGALYAWSVFTKLLTDPDGIYQFTATQTAWIFSAGLATFALVMVLAGRWQAKTGPRLMTVFGGLLLGLGFVLGGFFGSTFWAQFFFIGIVGGAGIGLAYVVPIAVGVKWFPNKKGMITGLAVAGFPAITADYFGNKEVGRNYGWVFTAYGVAGITGPLLAGVFKDAAAMGSSPKVWMAPFLIAGLACLLGALIMLFTNAPKSTAGVSPEEKAAPGPKLVLKKA
ncbi:MAG: MFS transporter [Xanthomonadales bacterium]